MSLEIKLYSSREGALLFTIFTEKRLWGLSTESAFYALESETLMKGRKINELMEVRARARLSRALAIANLGRRTMTNELSKQIERVMSRSVRLILIIVVDAEKKNEKLAR